MNLYQKYFTSLLLVLSVTVVNAQLNKSFGDNGFVFNGYGKGNTEILDIKKQSDGKIIALGTSKWVSGYTDIIIARYFPDGTIDSSFAIDGALVFNGGGDANRGIAPKLIIDAVDRFYCAGINAYNQLFIARFLSNGSFDESYGQNGFVIYEYDSNEFYNTILGLELLENNDIKIVNLIYEFKYNYPNFEFLFNGISHLIFDESGALDSTIIPGGIKENYYQDFDIALFNTEFQSTGKNIIGLVKIDSVTEAIQLYLMRNNVDGSLDSTFGVAGVSLVESQGVYYKYLIDDQDRIYLNFFSEGIGFIRLMPDGIIDSTFGNNGDGIVKINSSIEMPEYFQKTEFCFGPDSSIYFYASYLADEYSNDYTLKIVKVPFDGSIDENFGINGVVDLKADTSYLNFNNTLIDADKGLIFGGTVGASQDERFDFTLLKIDSLGEKSLEFGKEGWSINVLGYNLNLLKKIIELSDGSFVVQAATSMGIYDKFNSVFVKHHFDGAIDSSFGKNGVVYFYDLYHNTTANLIGEQADGGIVFTIQYPDFSVETSLQRINSSGIIDTTFGDKGIVRLDSTITIINSKVSEDGKIWIAGIKNANELVIQRFLPNGEKDIAWGVNGSLLSNVSINESLSYTHFYFLEDGSFILVAIENLFYNDAVSSIIKLKADGTVDESFANNGVYELDGELKDLNLQKEETLLILCNTSYDQVQLQQITKRGNPVVEFGIDSKVDFTFTENTEAYNEGKFVHITNDSLITVTGACAKPDVQNAEIVALCRFKLNGEKDESFGVDGKNLLNDFSYTSMTYFSFVTQKDANILLGGSTNPYYSSQYFVSKWGDNVATSVPQNKALNHSFFIYPNPVKDKFQASIYSDQPTEAVFILTNIAGVQLHSFGRYSLLSGKQVLDFNIPQNLPKGLYLLQMFADKKISSTKILKQ